MKKHNQILNTLKIIVLVCLVMFPLSFTKIHAAEYEIVFKAGAHGTINNEKSVIYSLQSGDIFPDEPTVIAEDGYVFSGWNKELPAVGSEVEGKEIYVAQYDVVVNGISYIVRYLDEQGLPIATAKSMMAEAGIQITERAKTIPGYTYQMAQQQFTLNESNKEVVFTYTLTNPEERITYVEEIVNVTVPGQTTGTGTGGTNNQTTNNQTPTDNTTTDIEDNNIPQGDGDNITGGEEDIEDQEVPLGQNKNNMESILAIGGTITVLAFIIIVLILVNRKNRREI